MPILNDKEYECDFCKNIFNLIRDNTWNEELAKEEYHKIFPFSKWEDRAIVCDDCWQKIKP